MHKRIIFTLLIVSMIGCAFFKERFGTGEETPELIAAREECRSLAEKEAAEKYESIISQKEHTRIAFDDCVEKRGFDRTGRKIKQPASP
jgi:hypothetical protein